MRMLSFLFLILPLMTRGQLLERLLQTDTSEIVRKVLADTAKYRLQIILTEVDEKSSIFAPYHPTLSTTTFRNRPSEYFFPASLIKLPVTALALEKINELSVYGISGHTPFMPLSDLQCQGKMAPKVFPASAEELIYKIFVHSDNAAFNYLYELCGQQYIQQRLQEMGYAKARIVEKIARCDGPGNRITGPIAFYDSSSRHLIHIEGRQSAAMPAAMEVNAKIGKGYIWNGKYVASPKDFSNSNFIPLQDLHQMLLALALPKEVEKNKRFQLSEDQRRWLLNAMSTLPSQYFIDTTQRKAYKDNHVKYLMGANDTIPTHWQVHNKVGLAHGFISDCTYLEDSQFEFRFFLSAVLYVNQDGVLNDGKYEYTTIGLPFLRRLGQLVYEYELGRKGKK
jgi:hypothetical protein